MRLNNIEFLRVFFSIAIVYRHLVIFFLAKHNPSNALFADLGERCYFAYLIVEMFFILAGYFFYQSIQSGKDIPWKDYTVGKIIRLWPVVCLSIALAAILPFFGIWKFYGFDNVMPLLFLHSTGIAKEGGNNPYAWFVCVLFFSLIFYYYLARNCKRSNLNLTIALITFVSYVILLNARDGSLSMPFDIVFGFFPAGLLRALGGVGIGYFVGAGLNSPERESQPQKRSSVLSMMIFSLMELALFWFLIYNLLVHKLQFRNDFIFIIAFVGLLILAVQRRGLISRLLDNPVSGFLGRYAYSIYVMHILILILADKFLLSNKVFIAVHPVATISIVLLAATLTGVLSYHLVERPAIIWLTRIWKNGKVAHHG